MDLAEFLLARIADDEERADFVRRQIEGNNWQPSEPWRLSWHDEYDLLCIEPSRVLAECETKRRIVMPHMGGHRCAWGDWYAAGECDAEVLRLLALPYADYDPEWRP